VILIIGIGFLNPLCVRSKFRGASTKFAAFSSFSPAVRIRVPVWPMRSAVTSGSRRWDLNTGSITVSKWMRAVPCWRVSHDFSHEAQRLGTDHVLDAGALGQVGASALTQDMAFAMQAYVMSAAE